MLVETMTGKEQEQISGRDSLRRRPDRACSVNHWAAFSLQWCLHRNMGTWRKMEPSCASSQILSMQSFSRRSGLARLPANSSWSASLWFFPHRGTFGVGAICVGGKQWKNLLFVASGRVVEKIITLLVCCLIVVRQKAWQKNHSRFKSTWPLLCNEQTTYQENDLSRVFRLEMNLIVD
jgi:hypothetical protein